MAKKGIVIQFQKIRKENRMIWVLVWILGVLLLVYCRQMYGVHETEENVQRVPEGAAKVRCESIFGWITREDRMITDGEEYAQGPDFTDLQPGDILLTLSTHSLGWRHGHVGLVIDENTTLESALIGTDSSYADPQNWRKYSNYCVLRVKGVSSEQQQAVVKYACENLYGVPYHLSAGFLKEKAPSSDSSGFGLQCAYLVWYAWYQLGYDLDSDGGRLVTASDLLASDLLEVVQVYGMGKEHH